MNTRKVEEYLKRLKRRERFLEQRVDGKGLSVDSHYDRAELAALKWSIRYVEDTIIEAAEHQYKWFEEQEGRNE